FVFFTHYPFLVVVSDQNSLRLDAEPGDNVTIWYQHSLTDPAYITWFRHQNLSLPDRLACQHYKLYFSPSLCHFVPQRNRIMMSVNSESTSLIITGVNYSDSGLYYCIIQRGNIINFSNATYVLVTGNFIYMFGAVIGILISVLLIILACRKQRRDDEDRVNYAALQFSSKKRTPRHREDAHVVYSSVKRY
uniref:Ig-like domain-containing protein n=1 Tax=Astyanax mexicanus TaxID=7994 RepID=A0A3B1KCQ7_ASTMX